MPTRQLTLDVLAAARIIGVRHTLTPEQHQRGWITLPRHLADFTPPGTVIPAWLCCICGGVEINSYGIERHHGCCDIDTIRMPCDRRDRWPGWALDFDPHWTLTRPPDPTRRHDRNACTTCGPHFSARSAT